MELSTVKQASFDEEETEVDDTDSAAAESVASATSYGVSTVPEISAVVVDAVTARMPQVASVSSDGPAAPGTQALVIVAATANRPEDFAAPDFLEGTIEQPVTGEIVPPAVVGSSVSNANAYTVVNELWPVEAPRSIAVSPDGTQVYVTNSNWQTYTVTVVDTSQGGLALVGAVTSGFRPAGLAVSPDGTRLYVSNEGGTLTVMDLTSAIPRVVVEVADAGGEDLALSPDGKRDCAHRKSPAVLVEIPHL